MPANFNGSKHFKAGMYLLENLTTGMYNEPLTIFREYIQNAVDSIDLSSNKGNNGLTKVDIELDPSERRITIRDNGIGISAKHAEQVLSSIGSSDKKSQNLRGFRGIGRLGGIAFSDRAVFRTKAEDEKVESLQEWDCAELRRILADPQKTNLSLENLFESTTNFFKNNSRSKGGFFEVSLYGVNSFRNYIFDIERVRNYLSQVAPVPFDAKNFSFGPKITTFLENQVKNYGEYNIYINGAPIYKPYRDEIKVTKDEKFDYIKDIKTFSININGNEFVAFGWYGERQELLGSIRKGESSAGIRVRIGNILLGDSHLLDKCFREDRFNSYLIGEIHVISPKLIPNSRRDDFVDNEFKTLFYNSVEEEIGLPISKEVRFRSRLNSGINTQKQGVTPALASKNKISHSSFRDCFKAIQNVCKKCHKLPKLITIMSDGKN